MSRRGASDRAVAVVPAAGMGARMGSRRPKQYLSLAGRPLLVHALRALRTCRGLDGVVLAVPSDRMAATRHLLARHRTTVLELIEGGPSRQESVWRGLQAVPAGPQWIVVHDGVRPFITGDLVEALLAAARRWGAATCGLEVRETVKRVTQGIVQATVPREGLWLAQTPQAFSRNLLWEAHEKARRDGFTGTDDAVLVERLGVTVTMVLGLGQNLKITTPEDLQAARAWAVPRRRK